jgi:hypothetical protein
VLYAVEMVRVEETKQIVNCLLTIKIAMHARETATVKITAVTPSEALSDRTDEGSAVSTVGVGEETEGVKF